LFFKNNNAKIRLINADSMGETLMYMLCPSGCSVVGGYQGSEGKYCLHLQYDL
jgi:hypothetical protein